MTKPLISVTVPAHNTAKYLPRCLDSILAQTYTHLEVICVDDGSTDDSLSIMQQYAARDSRIKVFALPEARGVSAARNMAHRHSTGEFVTSVDSDDYIPPHSYETAVSLISPEVDWVCYAAQLVDEHGNKLEDPDSYYACRYEGVLTLTPEIIGNINACIWSKLWRKSVMDAHNMVYPEGLVHEDNAMCCQFAPFVRKVAFSNETGYFYVRRTGSIMNCNRSTMDETVQCIGVLRHVYNFYQHAGLTPSRNPYYVRQFATMYYQIERHSLPQERHALAHAFRTLAEEIGLLPQYAADPRFRCMYPPAGFSSHFIQRRSFRTQYKLGPLPVISRQLANGIPCGWRLDIIPAICSIPDRIMRNVKQGLHLAHEKLHMHLYGYDCWHGEMKRRILASTYKKTSAPPATPNRLVVFMTEDTEYAGLADRLRTFISAHIIATENNRNLCIYHDKGFQLEKYLISNKINWHIEPQHICRGLNHVNILWFNKELPPAPLQADKEYHAYALFNIIPSLSKEKQQKYSYAEVFRTLFKPTPYLNNLIKAAMQSCELQENRYVTAHLRFLNFFEPVEEHVIHASGSPEQQDKMIAAVHATLELIHKESGGDPILLFSDSNRFLQAPHPDYVKVLPGTVGHIIRHNGTDEITDKTFTDLMVMSKAKRIYRITGKHIYNGGFAQTAADIGGKELIERPYPQG